MAGAFFAAVFLAGTFFAAAFLVGAFLAAVFFAGALVRAGATTPADHSSTHSSMTVQVVPRAARPVSMPR